MIKEEYEEIKRDSIIYLKKDNNLLKHKPWLGDLLSAFYDPIMEKSIFPKKFDASITGHKQFLKDCYSNIHNLNVLELAAGSGDIAQLLPDDNDYTGIDISRGLLKIAERKFRSCGFKNIKLYICSADELPFIDNYFNFCICNLSLNFFIDTEKVIKEIYRVLRINGVFICSVPVPERNIRKNTIRGRLYSEEKMKNLFVKYGFNFEPFNFKNGSLLYFRTIKIE